MHFIGNDGAYFDNYRYLKPALTNIIHETILKVIKGSKIIEELSGCILLGNNGCKTMLYAMVFSSSLFNFSWRMLQYHSGKRRAVRSVVKPDRILVLSYFQLTGSCPDFAFTEYLSCPSAGILQAGVTSIAIVFLLF